MLRKLIYCIIGCAVFTACTEDKPIKQEVLIRSYFCDSEEVTDGKFSGDNAEFGNGLTQTDEFAFEGSYASKVGGEHPFGMDLVIKDLKAGNFVVVEVYQKGGNYSNSIVISDKTGETYVRASSDFEEQNGWRKLVLEFTVDTQTEWLKAYVINESDDYAYFDNFKVTVYPERPAGGDGLPKMYLDFKPADFQNLSQKAKTARNLSILTKATKKNVKVK